MPTVAKLTAYIQRFATLVFSLVLTVGLAGCVSVRIDAGGGQVRTFEHVGVLRIELANPQQAITGSVLGVGLVGAPLGWSLGYTRQRWALLGSGCRTVVWLAAGDLDESTRKELARAAGVCLIDDAATASSTVSSTVAFSEATP